MAVSISTAIAIAAFTISAASAAYQVVQAKQMQKKAEAAAEARRGFEVPIEGDAANAALIYGRAMVGGARTWHAVQGGFNYVTPNSDKMFLTGTTSRDAYVQQYSSYGGSIMDSLTHMVAELQSVNIPSVPAGYLDHSMTGSKNEFLYFQQALCVGPINSIQDVVIDGGRYIDDPALGTYGYAEDIKKSQTKAALRIDCHFGDTPTADAIAAANFGDRADAVFDGIAYASAVVRIDRNQPQFNNVPQLQFLIEGRKVRKVVDGVLQSVRVYTTNPAWCLLDYLLDENVGKGVPEDEIDLLSFENAALIFDSIVQTNVAVGGKFWQPTDGSRNITHRDLPLYECNIVIDPSKPMRENIESMLSTCGDTRLVWSGGQYHLNAQYPASNDAIVVDEVITDDDLILDQEIGIVWPTASERLNNATVRFHNEHEGFKEDTVSWPPKYTESYWKGIGGVRYGLPNGSWGEDTDGDRLLNNYGVWDTDASNITLTYLFKVDPSQAASCKTWFTGDDSMSFTIYECQADGSNSSPVVSGSRPPTNYDHHLSYTGWVQFGAPDVTKFYKVVINAHDNGSTEKGAMKGVAVMIESSSSILWSTREPSYTQFVQMNYDSAVYDQMMAEDGHCPLETDVFADGITDPYHALAKAEEMVRTSRSAFQITFKYKVKDKYLEPGDFIKLQSETLGIGFGSNPLYIRVNGAKVNEKAECEISGTRFDWTQLAWNVKDNVYLTPRSIYESQVGLISNLQYAPPISTLVPSSGVLSWTAAAGSDVAGYVIYAFDPNKDAYDAMGQPIYNEIGRTSAAATSFVVPPLETASAFFGVRTMALGGRLSTMVILDVATGQDLYHNWLNGLQISLSDYGFSRRSSDLALVPSTITATANVYNYITPQFRWFVDGVEQASTTNQLVIPAFGDVRMKLVEVWVNELGGTSVQKGHTSVVFADAGSHPLLSVKADRSTITLDSMGNPNPSDQTITFTASKYNLAETPLTWTVHSLTGVSSDPSTVLSSASGDEVNMTSSSFIAATGVSDGVMVTVSGTSIDGTAISASVSVTKAAASLDAVSVVISRPFVYVPADSDGLNPNFKNTGAQLNVYEGTTQLSCNPTTGSGRWTATADGGGVIATGTLTSDGITGTFSDITAMSADGGKVTYTITGKRANGTDFTLLATETYLKVRGAVIDLNPPGPASFGSTPVVYSVATLADGSVRVTAALSWTAPTSNATDLNYYEVGIRKHGTPDYIVSQTSTTSYSWVVEPGVSYDYTVRAVDNSTNKGDYVELLNQTAVGDTTIPAAPSGGTAVTSIRTAFLKWTNSLDADLAEVQVYEASVPSGGSAPAIPAAPLATVNATPGKAGAYSRSGLSTGTDYYYWLKSVDTSGNVSPASAIMGPFVSSSVASEDFTANTINANILQSGTSLPAGLILGATGFQLGDVSGILTNQAGTTYVAPGKVFINGSTTLASWQNGTDQTKIEGGSIAANTVKANSLQIGNRGVDISGIQFQASVDGNGAPTGQVTWTAGTVVYTNDTGTQVAQAVSSGAVTWTAGIVYIYWVKGSSTLGASTAMGTAYGSDRIVLATYSGGVGLVVTYGKTLVNGSDITAGTITGDRIKANSVTADRIDSRGLSIKDSSGNVILAAGSPLAYTNVSGGPPSNATNGATFGSNIFGQITSGNVSTYIAAAAITDAQIANLDAGKINVGILNADRINAGTITTAHLVGAAVTNIVPYINSTSINIPYTSPATLVLIADWNHTNEAGGYVEIISQFVVYSPSSQINGFVMHIYRDGAEIATPSYAIGVGQTQAVVWFHLDNPGVGAHHYQVYAEIARFGSSMTVQTAMCRSMEFKR